MNNDVVLLLSDEEADTLKDFICSFHDNVTDFEYSRNIFRIYEKIVTEQKQENGDV